jgi:hypothetical protein
MTGYTEGSPRNVRIADNPSMVRLLSISAFVTVHLINEMLGLNPHRFDPPHIKAHEHCSLNRSEVEGSSQCGCFYCFATFPPNEVCQWIDDGQTALCPKCEIDSVIGSMSGFPITRGFLMSMHDHWF